MFDSKNTSKAWRHSMKMKNIRNMIAIRIVDFFNIAKFIFYILKYKELASSWPIYKFLIFQSFIIVSFFRNIQITSKHNVTYQSRKSNRTDLLILLSLVCFGAKFKSLDWNILIIFLRMFQLELSSNYNDIFIYSIYSCFTVKLITFVVNLIK